MPINIELSSIFREFIDEDSFSIEISELQISIASMLRIVSLHFSHKVDKLLYGDNQYSINTGLIIKINDRVLHAASIDPNITFVGSDDRISLLYTISGG